MDYNETIIEIEMLQDASDSLDAEAICPCGSTMCCCGCVLPDEPTQTS